MADEPGEQTPAQQQANEHVKAFLLDLAAKGKGAWNTWRRDPANKDVRVTFAGIDFSEAPKDQIDFQGFEFGDHANLSQCKWRGGNWEEIQKDPGNFTPGCANFTAATFGDEASFTGAVFGDCAKFTSVTFGERANFTAAAFGNLASFVGAAFGDQANFVGAAFGELARFDDTVFKGRVEITGITFVKWEAFKALLAVGHPHRATWPPHSPGPASLVSISFARARFDDGANFSGRSFYDAADFTNARFYSPPDFDAAASAARIDFSGVHIGFVPPGRLLHWTSESKVPVRLRRLRKIAEETKNHDLGRDLYIEERKAERGVYLSQLLERDELDKKLRDVTEQKKHVWLEWRLQRRARNAHWLGILTKPDKIARLAIHGSWIGVMGFYWALADYGRNFLVPAIWLGLSVPFFDWRYTEVLARLMAKAPDVDKYKQAVGMLALGNAVPFVGPLTIDAEVKKFLFCPGGDASCLPPIPPEGFQALVIAQNVLSIILVFFVGLALRNYFRIK